MDTTDLIKYYDSLSENHFNSAQKYLYTGIIVLSAATAYGMNIKAFGLDPTGDNYSYIFKIALIVLIYITFYILIYAQARLGWHCKNIVDVLIDHDKRVNDNNKNLYILLRKHYSDMTIRFRGGSINRTFALLTAVSIVLITYTSYFQGTIDIDPIELIVVLIITSAFMIYIFPLGILWGLFPLLHLFVPKERNVLEVMKNAD